jgi:hypothetical protein
MSHGIFPPNNKEQMMTLTQEQTQAGLDAGRNMTEAEIFTGIESVRAGGQGWRADRFR